LIPEENCSPEGGESTPRTIIGWDKLAHWRQPHTAVLYCGWSVSHLCLSFKLLTLMVTSCSTLFSCGLNPSIRTIWGRKN